MGTMTYWYHKIWIINIAKEKIPQQLIIGHTCFISIAGISGKLYSAYPNDILIIFIKIIMIYYLLSSHW